MLYGKLCASEGGLASLLGAPSRLDSPRCRLRCRPEPIFGVQQEDLLLTYAEAAALGEADQARWVAVFTRWLPIIWPAKQGPQREGRPKLAEARGCSEPHLVL